MAISKASSDNIPSNLLDFVSLHIVLDIKHSITRFVESYWSLLFHSKLSNAEAKFEQKTMISEVSNNKNYLTNDDNKGSDDDYCLLGGDVDLVLERLGIQHSFDGEELNMKWDFSEIADLFEEKEPSLEEVKEAFDVFDENKDGFIDAGELQRVLLILGLRQGSELQACSNMIKAFDQNKDGKIDFNEFVRFMLNHF
ncbi:hypothetical protein BVRB_2g046880 [Beta vulgaris subsp. vulgaris]|nr:hypothetical protein BVRB_2g046880 [Beta vulgaris subsp. vulgaris]